MTAASPEIELVRTATADAVDSLAAVAVGVALLVAGLRPSFILVVTVAAEVEIAVTYQILLGYFDFRVVR